MINKQVITSVAITLAVLAVLTRADGTRDLLIGRKSYF